MGRWGERTWYACEFGREEQDSLPLSKVLDLTVVVVRQRRESPTSSFMIFLGHVGSRSEVMKGYQACELSERRCKNNTVYIRFFRPTTLSIDVLARWPSGYGWSSDLINLRLIN